MMGRPHWSRTERETQPDGAARALCVDRSCVIRTAADPSGFRRRGWSFRAAGAKMLEPDFTEP